MFNGFDLIILVLVLLFCTVGFRTGIVTSLFCISSGYIGLYVAKKYCVLLGMNFYLVFALAALVIILAGLFFGRLAQEILLGAFDNILGSALGAAFAIMMVSILMFPVLGKLSWQNQVYVMASYSGSHIIPWVQKTLPPVKELSFSEIQKMLEEQKLIAEKAGVETPQPAAAKSAVSAKKVKKRSP